MRRRAGARTGPAVAAATAVAWTVATGFNAEVVARVATVPAGCNVVALPLAAGVLAPWGILLSPAVGAILMSLSTIIVAINAQLLRRARL